MSIRPPPPSPPPSPLSVITCLKGREDNLKTGFLLINTESCYKDSKHCSVCKKIHFFYRCSTEKRLVSGSDVKWLKLEVRRNLRELKSPCPCQTLVHRRLTIYLPIFVIVVTCIHQKVYPHFLTLFHFKLSECLGRFYFFAIGSPQSRSSDCMRRYRKRKFKSSGLYLVSGEYSSSQVSPPF